MNVFYVKGPLIDKMVAVSEEWIAISILRLVEQEKAVVEGAGASGVAAVLAGLLPELRGKKFVPIQSNLQYPSQLMGPLIDEEN